MPLELALALVAAVIVLADALARFRDRHLRRRLEAMERQTIARLLDYAREESRRA